MEGQRAPSPVSTALLMAMLSLVWGTSWLAIKIGLKDVPPFTGATLRFNGAAAGAGASASVTESFAELEDADLFVYSLGRHDRDLVDSTDDIGGLTSLRVSKDILVDSGARRDISLAELERLCIPKKLWKKRGRGIAVISRIEQRFDTEPVPEPAGMLLFGAALLGIAAVRRNLQ